MSRVQIKKWNMEDLERFLLLFIQKVRGNQSEIKEPTTRVPITSVENLRDDKKIKKKVIKDPLFYKIALAVGTTKNIKIVYEILHNCKLLLWE